MQYMVIKRQQVSSDWSSAPEWAKYLAMDADGDWTWFEHKPRYVNVAWVASGRQLTIRTAYPTPADSLVERPR